MLKKLILTKFKKPTNRIGNKVFDDSLIKEKAVVYQSPEFIQSLDKDIIIEFYVGDSASGERTWAISVISVRVGKFFWKHKYDSGRINNDLPVMVEECLTTIKRGWDLNAWRKQAREEIANNLNFKENLQRWWDKVYKTGSLTPLERV